MSSPDINLDKSKKNPTLIEEDAKTSITNKNITQKLGTNLQHKKFGEKIIGSSSYNRKVRESKFGNGIAKLVTGEQRFKEKSSGQNIIKKELSEYNADDKKLNQSMILTSGRSRLTISHTNDDNEDEQKNTVEPGRLTAFSFSGKHGPDGPGPSSQSMFISTGSGTGEKNNQNNTFDRIAGEFPEYKEKYTKKYGRGTVIPFEEWKETVYPKYVENLKKYLTTTNFKTQTSAEQNLSVKNSTTKSSNDDTHGQTKVTHNNVHTKSYFLGNIKQHIPKTDDKNIFNNIARENRSQTSNTSSSGGTTNSIGQTSDKYVSNGKVTAKDHKQINDKTVHSHNNVHSYDDSIDNNSANFAGNTISRDPIPMLNTNIIDIGDTQIQQYLEEARYRIDSQFELIEKANNYIKDKNYSHANEIVKHIDIECKKMAQQLLKQCVELREQLENLESDINFSEEGSHELNSYSQKIENAKTISNESSIQLAKIITKSIENNINKPVKNEIQRLIMVINNVATHSDILKTKVEKIKDSEVKFQKIIAESLELTILNESKKFLGAFKINSKAVDKPNLKSIGKNANEYSDARDTPTKK